MENVGVPESCAADLPEGDAWHVLGAPAEDPHVEERITEIAGDVASDALRQRPGHDQRQEEIQSEGQTFLHDVVKNVEWARGANTKT